MPTARPWEPVSSASRRLIKTDRGRLAASDRRNSPSRNGDITKIGRPLSSGNSGLSRPKPNARNRFNSSPAGAWNLTRRSSSAHWSTIPCCIWEMGWQANAGNDLKKSDRGPFAENPLTLCSISSPSSTNEVSQEASKVRLRDWQTSRYLAGLSGATYRSAHTLG